MKPFLIPLLSCFLLVLSSLRAVAYEIKGKINNVSDSTYANFSYIHTVDDFFELGHDMVIRKVRVESDGSFVIKGNKLSENDRFYRLSFAEGEKMITYTTGNERNNLCLFMNNDSEIAIDARMDEFLLFDVKIVADNDYCNFVNDIDLTIQSLINDLFEDELNFAQKKIVRQRAQEYANNYIDTCKYPILRYYLYVYAKGYDLKLDSFAEKDIYELMKQYYPKSIYTKELLARNNLHDKSIPWYYRLVLLILALYSVIVSYLYFGKRRQSADCVKLDLTVKEMVILKAIAEGKLNKEIADDMSVEISTVKSHISNLYKKLNIRNRAQAASYYRSRSWA